jgi:hypothetical protein
LSDRWYPSQIYPGQSVPMKIGEPGVSPEVIMYGLNPVEQKRSIGFGCGSSETTGPD